MPVSRAKKEEKVVKRLNKQIVKSTLLSEYKNKGGDPVKRSMNLSVGKTFHDNWAAGKPNDFSRGFGGDRVKNSKQYKIQKEILRKSDAKRAVVKTAAKTALKAAGPVGIAVTLFDFLKGKPAY